MTKPNEKFTKKLEKRTERAAEKVGSKIPARKKVTKQERISQTEPNSGKPGKSPSLSERMKNRYKANNKKV